MSFGFNAPQGFASVNFTGSGNQGGKLGEYIIAGGVNPGAGPATSLVPPIFNGDLVRYTIAEDVNAGTGAVAGSIVPVITPARNAVQGGVLPILGVFRGCKYYDINNNLVRSEYYPGNLAVKPGTSIIALIDDDPTIIGSIQMSTSVNVNDANAMAKLPYLLKNGGVNAYVNVTGGAWTNVIPYNGAGNPSINVQPANPGVGNAITGVSGYYLDASSIGYDVANGNPTYSLKIIGLDNNPANIVAANVITTVGGTNYTGLFVNYFVKINNHVYGSNGTPGPKSA